MAQCFTVLIINLHALVAQFGSLVNIIDIKANQRSHTSLDSPGSTFALYTCNYTPQLPEQEPFNRIKLIVNSFNLLHMLNNIGSEITKINFSHVRVYIFVDSNIKWIKM